MKTPNAWGIQNTYSRGRTFLVFKPGCFYKGQQKLQTLGSEIISRGLGVFSFQGGLFL